MTEWWARVSATATDALLGTCNSNKGSYIFDNSMRVPKATPLGITGLDDAADGGAWAIKGLGKWQCQKKALLTSMLGQWKCQESPMFSSFPPSPPSLSFLFTYIDPPLPLCPPLPLGLQTWCHGCPRSPIPPALPSLCYILSLLFFYCLLSLPLRSLCVTDVMPAATEACSLTSKHPLLTGLPVPQTFQTSVPHLWLLNWWKVMCWAL